MRAALALLVLAAVGCSARPDEASSTTTEPQALSEPPATKATGPVIATLATHDKKVAIVGGGDELHVIVRSGDGAILADGLTLPELRRFDPLLGFIVTDAVASNGGGGTYVDATLTLPEPIKAP